MTSSTIHNILSNLKSKSSIDRENATLSLREYVTTTANNSDEFSDLMKDLSVKIFEILLSRENHEVMGGILAIEKVRNVIHI